MTIFRHSIGNFPEGQILTYDNDGHDLVASGNDDSSKQTARDSSHQTSDRALGGSTAARTHHGVHVDSSRHGNSCVDIGDVKREL